MIDDTTTALSVHTHITLGAVRVSLAKLGLHVVTDADLAVLDACSALPEADLREAALEDNAHPSGARLARAESARRESLKPAAPKPFTKA